MKFAPAVPFLVTLACVLPATGVQGATIAARDPAADEAEALRQSGDLDGQRRHAWAIVAALTRAPPGSNRPFFETWHGEETTFAPQGGDGDGGTSPEVRGIRAFARRAPVPAAGTPPIAAGQTGDIPVLTYTLYDESAYNHIRARGLYRRTELDRLREAGDADRDAPGDRTIAGFPAGAHILKTAWWPIAADRATALPVWDAELNPVRPGGNPYTDWKRIVLISAGPAHPPVAGHPAGFAGRLFARPPRFDLDALYHVPVDSALAARMMRDTTARKATLIALGRELRGGDFLVLVSANIAAREGRTWVWATLWWHDRPAVGPFAAGRPDSLQGAWRHYLLQTAFDAERPAAADGGPHVCFDPWLEGRLPDGGNGGGTASNCVACHRRASYPPIDYLPITRGAPDRARDPAFAAGRLRTDDIWSIALHARQ